MSTWKGVERAIGRVVGGTRVPVSGRQRGATPDIACDRLAPEVKHRKSLPGWLHDAMDQAQKSKRGEQLPIVVLHGKNMPYTSSMVLIRLDDFMEWYGDPWETVEETSVGGEGDG